MNNISQVEIEQFNGPNLHKYEILSPITPKNRKNSGTNTSKQKNNFAEYLFLWRFMRSWAKMYFSP